MEHLSMQLENKKARGQKEKDRYSVDSVSPEELHALFPLPRYFQIHFNHLHEKLAQTTQQTEELKQRMSRIEKKIDRLLAMMASEETV